ncbi:uncharacterized protein AAGF69_003646 isoform 4-T7 [Amazona ochrocephala]
MQLQRVGNKGRQEIPPDPPELRALPAVRKTEMQEVKRDADHLNYTTKYSAGKTQHGSVTRRGRNSSGASDQALHATSPSCILQWLRYN